MEAAHCLKIVVAHPTTLSVGLGDAVWCMQGIQGWVWWESFQEIVKQCHCLSHCELLPKTVFVLVQNNHKISDYVTLQGATCLTARLRKVTNSAVQRLRKVTNLAGQRLPNVTNSAQDLHLVPTDYVNGDKVFPSDYVCGKGQKKTQNGPQTP